MAMNLRCSKCSGEMQEGLVVDLGYTGILRSMWVEDQAGNGGAPGTIDNNKRKVKTITYRCLNCGFLDSY
jgi:DNA-directed RNA polymerase subunit RPC12/RpoP